MMTPPVTPRFPVLFKGVCDALEKALAYLPRCLQVVAGGLPWRNLCWQSQHHTLILD